MGKRKIYTLEEPYDEVRTIKNITFSKDLDKKVFVKISMDCSESWEICHDQWKDLGKPSVGDKLLIRISPEAIKA